MQPISDKTKSEDHANISGNCTRRRFDSITTMISSINGTYSHQMQSAISQSISPLIDPRLLFQQQQTTHLNSYAHPNSLSGRQPSYVFLNQSLRPNALNHFPNIQNSRVTITPPTHARKHVQQNFAVVRDNRKRKIDTTVDTDMYPLHFKKGSIIELADGSLKKIEELKENDLKQSAEGSKEYLFDYSELINMILDDCETAKLTFSVGKSRVEVNVMAALEHPFFVIGKGWTSCNPERSLARYGLDCKRFEVGDSCISLTPLSDNLDTNSK